LTANRISFCLPSRWQFSWANIGWADSGFETSKSENSRALQALENSFLEAESASAYFQSP
jgi:hypothetical protein